MRPIHRAQYSDFEGRNVFFDFSFDTALHVAACSVTGCQCGLKPSLARSMRSTVINPHQLGEHGKRFSLVLASFAPCPALLSTEELKQYYKQSAD